MVSRPVLANFWFMTPICVFIDVRQFVPLLIQ